MTNASDTTPMGQPIPDEVLMAYVDGELSEAEREAVQAALATQPSLMQRVESFSFTRGPLLRPFDAVLAAPIPERLSALLADVEPRVVRRVPAPSGASKLRDIVAGFWAPFLSPAAAIPVVLLGVAAGWLLQHANTTQFVSLDDRGGLVASAPLQAALEATPTGTRVSVGSRLAVEPRFTFANTKKGWCRQYELIQGDGQVAGGLACRDQGVWKVIAQSPVLPRRDTAGRTVPAGDDEGVVGEVRSALQEGAVLGRTQEERLIREGWSAKPQGQ